MSVSENYNIKLKVDTSDSEANIKRIFDLLQNLESTIRVLNKQRIDIDFNKSKLESLKQSLQGISKYLDRIEKNSLVVKVNDKQLSEARKETEQLDKQLDAIEKDTTHLKVDTSQLESASKIATKLNNTKINIKSNMGSLGQSMSNFGTRMLQPGRNGNNVLGSISHFLVQGVGYSMMYRGVTSFFNGLNNILDGTVERFDTLNASKNTFMRMGFDDNTINSAITKLQDNLYGLPTKLNDGVSAVSGIVAVNGDLDKSVDIFSALNDGVLAFGGTATQAKNATRQLVQAMGKGKLLAQDYNAISDAAPALMGLMAKQFNMSTGEMKEALKEGDISINDFVDTLIRLDKYGDESTASLRQIAKEASNISLTATAEALSTRIQNAGTVFLSNLNEVLSQTKLGSLQNILNTIGNAFAGGVENFSQYLLDNAPQIADGIDMIVGKLQEFWNSLKGFDISKFFSGFESWKWVFDTIKMMIQGTLEIVKMVASFIGGGDASKGLGWILGFWLSTSAILQLVGKSMVRISKLKGIASTFKSLDFLSLFAKSGSSKKPGNPMLPLGWEDLGGLGSKSVGANIATSFANAGKNLLTLAGMAVNIMLYAEALKQVSEKIPDDIGGLVKKLGVLGVAMGAMYAFTGIIGDITQKNDPTKIGTGVLGLIAVSGTIMLLAEAMSNIDRKVPSDIGNFASKMANMAIAIGGFTAVITAIGALATLGGGIGGAIIAIGAVFTLGIVATLWGVAECIAQMTDAMVDIVENLERFGDVKVNKSSVRKNLKKIFDVLDQIAEYSPGLLDSIGKIVDMKIDEGVYSQASSNLEKIMDITDVLDKLQNVEINGESIGQSMKAINSGLESLEVLKPAEMSITPDQLDGASNVLKKLPQVVDDLIALSNYDPTQYSEKAIKKAVSSINSALSIFSGDEGLELPDATSTPLTKTNAENLVGFVDGISQFLPALQNLKVPEGFNTDNVKNVVQQIVDLISWMRNYINKDGSTLKTAFTGFKIETDTVQNVIDVVNSFNTLIQAFNNIDTESIPNADKINAIKTTMSTLTDLLSQFTYDEDGFFGALDSMVGYTKRIAEVQDDFASLSEVLTSINTIIQQFGNLGKDSSGGYNVNLGENSYVYNILQNLKKLMEDLANDDFTSAFSSDTLSSNLDALQKAVDKINTVNTTLNTVQSTPFSYDTIKSIITNLQNIMNDISGITGVSEAQSLINQINTVIEQFQTLLTTLSGFNEQFQTVGNGWGTALYTGFDESDPDGKMVDLIESAMKDLKALDFTPIGNSYGTQITNGFKATLNFSGAMSNAMSTLSGYSSQFATIGATLGNSMANAISDQLGTIKVPDISTNGTSTPKTSKKSVRKAKGGEVPSYYAKGGIVYMKPRGTDKVPSMLTKGEFVIRKKAVDKYGTGLLNRINNLDLDRFVRRRLETYGRNQYNNQTTNIYNYVTNNDNRRIDFHNVKERKQAIKASRYLKGAMA